MAPLEWRIEQVMKNQNLTREKALDLITTKDANRKRFLEYYLGQKFQIQIFDIVYNCQNLTIDEIADSIMFAIAHRKMV